MLGPLRPPVCICVKPEVERRSQAQYTADQASLTADMILIRSDPA